MKKTCRPSPVPPASFSRRLPAIVLLVAGTGLAAAQPSAEPGRPRGPYFGQASPGETPSVFAPGIVSIEDRYEYVIAFSPDGTECVFGVTDSQWSTCDLYYSRQVEGAWTVPAKAAFQGEGDGWLPSFSPDGERIFFSSGRPDIMKIANSYVCERAPGGWGPPAKMGGPVNSPSFDWRPHATSGGVLYFTSDRGGGLGEMDIYRSEPDGGEYRTVENLGPPVNSPHLDASPWVSLDEEVLTFESWRPGGYGKGDLYISYRKVDGSWTRPQNLGPAINTDQIEDGGYISPDGRYFFFNRRRDWVTEEPTDIWWIDIRAIYRPYVQNPLGRMNAVEGEALSWRVPNDAFADHDDPRLAFSASSPGGAPLPPWLAFDAGTRTLTGRPDRAGEIAVRITATDSSGSACSDLLTLSIAP